MIDADRVLRPLHEAAPSIEKLETYESPAVLTEALRATWHAVDRTLRLLLRSDATAPDAIRLSAMSPDQMPLDTVVAELRRRELISLAVAGRAHELAQAVQRAAQGSTRAADADNARETVRALENDVHVAAGRGQEPHILPGSVLDNDPEVGAVVAVRPDRPRRRVLLLGVVAAVLLIATIAAVWLLSRPSEMEQGIAAFQDDRMGVAEQHFRAALAEDRTNVSAQLYLARILRQDGRHQEAAELLRSAALRAPNDAAVRRELGYLFLALNRASTAAEQFQRAVELEPEEPLNWIGVVEALTRAGDREGAQEWLRRAPAAAQQRIRN